MLLNLALNGSKRRDLRFSAGDQEMLSVAVYANDGDIVPLTTVTNPRIVTCPGATVTIPVSTVFVVPDDCCGRQSYRLIAEVAGVTTTLAHGVMLTRGGHCGGRWDYGFSELTGGGW